MKRTMKLDMHSVILVAAGVTCLSLVPLKAYPQDDGVDMACSPTLADDCSGSSSSDDTYYEYDGGGGDVGDNRLRNGNIDEGFFETRPEPGYAWVDPSSEDDLRVYWSPGKEHSEYPHVIAGDSERVWFPERGYTWVGEPPPRGRWRVRWTPGVELPGNPNVIASEEEGQFHPRDGFVWANNPATLDDPRVQWQIGLASREFPHVIAGYDENTFIPAGGYDWLLDPRPPGDFRVRWTPYTDRTGYSHVIASEIEGEFEPEAGYDWLGDPATGDMRVAWTPGVESNIENLLTGEEEGTWIPAEGYQWIHDSEGGDLQIGPIPPATPQPAPLTVADTEVLRNGLIEGTAAQLGFAVPERPTREQRRHVQQLLRQQSELMGNDYESGIDTRRYDFAIGVAVSTNIFADLSTRVLLDQLSQGRATPWLQDEYNKLRGRRFGELGCHSNGAMICLTALQNGHITAKHVVLYGPQITVESLRMWETLVREGRVGSIEMLINQNDPVPPLSLLASATVGPFGSVVAQVAALPLFFNTAAMEVAVQYVAPSISVSTSTCSSSIASLQCHDMAQYRAARGCMATPESSGLSVPGTALPGQRPLTEPPPPC